MNEEQAITVLEGYCTSLAKIENRFTEDRSGIHIEIDDITKVKQLVIEASDSFYDLFGGNKYSRMMTDSYNEGISNITSSPSLHCVKDLQVIISSVITRIKNNPDILTPKEDSEIVQTTNEIKIAEIPEKVTLAWLFRHVSISFWLYSGGLIISAFYFGIEASQWGFIKDIFGLAK